MRPDEFLRGLGQDKKGREFTGIVLKFSQSIFSDIVDTYKDLSLSKCHMT